MFEGGVLLQGTLKSFRNCRALNRSQLRAWRFVSLIMQFVLRDTGCAEYSMKHHVRTILAILKLIHGGSARLVFLPLFAIRYSKQVLYPALLSRCPLWTLWFVPGPAVQIPELWPYQSSVNPQESVC